MKLLVELKVIPDNNNYYEIADLINRLLASIWINMTNPLSNLKLDYWYHVLTVLGAVFLFTSLTVKLEGIENSTVQILSLSSLCIGIGEWVNHAVLTEIVRSKRTGEIEGDLVSYPRNNTKVGITFVVLGFLFLSIGIYKIFY